ncbi:RHS repeat-associated core domain-containing protein [Persicobacter diffluens]|uniref:RHS repeat-associated core domain-containing protein n=1 Tax=Persicobacter diffluens TaxID=981 RepID=A0AAN4W543_9BACT|nr:hypothetical protein PEDI_55660 [Persicobacter diffluens]
MFNGKELDDETGLYYYGARYYDPRSSVWLSVDPLAEKYPRLSSMAYCANNPVNFIDPDGREILFPRAQWWGNSKFSWNFQEDINDIYSSSFGKALVRDLHSSEVKIQVTNAATFIGNDMSDLKNSITEGSPEGGPRIFTNGTKNVGIRYASVANLYIDDVLVKSSWEILAHEMVHARDFANSYFKNIKKEHNLNEKQIHEIGEIRSMIFTNSMRLEKYGKETQLRTKYRGGKLLNDDGITPIKDYGFDITEGLLKTIEE